MWHVYFRAPCFLIPVVANTDAGFFLDIAPVEKVQRTDDRALVAALERVFRQGNPKVATPNRDTFPTPVVLGPAGVKSWTSFEKSAICWTITQDGDERVVAATGRAENGGWSDAPELTVRLRLADASAVAATIRKHLESRSDV
jgi:hypothetical protein